MEPVTHALTSLLLARAGQRHLPRYGTAMLIVSGIAPDLDYLSYVAGASAFLRFHRTVLHSLAGSAVLTVVIAAIFCRLDRHRLHKNSASPSPALRFLPALAVCAVGTAAYVLLDLVSGIGVRLLWPFRQGWFAADLLTNLDLWILVILLLGILLPELFRLVGEEIGERKKTTRGRGAAVIALLFIVLYVGARAEFHSRAIDVLNSRDYHGAPPLDADAFPTGYSPFRWRAVIATDNAIDEAEISLAPGAPFDPDRALMHYKPQDSAALDAAQRTATARRFLAYARFPLASVEPSETGYRVSIRDLRFPLDDSSWDNIVAIVELDPDAKVTSQKLLHASSSDR
ncbi:MAG: metal-dependent hydrolase [Candidatus Acidiferrales bacterium]